MKRRPLGSTGMEVSVLGLGTVKLGRNRGVRYPRPYDLPDERDARRLLDTAADLGINLIDTAPAYGSAEARIGRLLAGQRGRWVLCSKAGEQFDAGVSRFDFRPEALRASVEGSLTRLGTDVLDVLLLHSSGDDVQILEGTGTLDCLRELKRAGKLRAFGISHKTETGGRLAVDLGCEVLMTTLSRAAPEQAGLVADAGAGGCGVLVKKALGSGHEDLDSLVYAASRPGVSAVVVGTLDPAHLAADAAAVQSL